ncbi:glycoside hydrolase family 97 protein [Muricauda sp. SCSIO 64092]|uniref:glycoside hydrolase family 97 protein n=1 Tax=Allomuricauda sp. SCSIO 64092 TaxID=2908842 RepID=UPI001FF2659F|nr:glycoside hydrolase family 97 protein [Muricauda sp. SCSIO 64092]UOY04945.1 glycoside hydrolase family 97 protein [Muricauda sp. SCSIO 64092]
MGLSLLPKSLYLLVLALALILQSCGSGESVVTKSPDGKVVLEIINVEGQLKYRVLREGRLMMDSSAISIIPDSRFTITKISQNGDDRTWEPVWGQFSSIRDSYQETILAMDFDGVSGQLVCRAYDKGVAFRFKLSENSPLEQVSYECEFNLPIGSKFYHTSGESKPIGPIAVSDVSKKVKLPVVVENALGGYMSILESDLYSARGFSVMDIEADKERNLLIAANTGKTENGRIKTPWRVILLEEKIGNLVVNTVPINLAAPNQLQDVSWIKPGKALWDWRVHGYEAPNGFKYGINTESYLRFIDFAAAHDIEYFLIDDAWYTHVSKGHIEHSDKLDLPKVSQYAKEKDVGLILYYDRKKGKYGDEDLFDYYRELGMKGIKYGFMGSDVPFTQSAIAQSAQNKLLIDFHDGPVPFTGIRRTLPNAVTREYCHAQQDARRAFTPEAFIRMALINAIQGPLDMNNGNFDITGINSGKRQKGPRQLNSYPTTVTAEAARTLIIFSGLVCLPDAPEAYSAKADLFGFIKELPIGKWDESRVLYANMDLFISTARRHGDAWFVGSVASQKGASLDIEMDFLKDGTEYNVTYYEDAEDTHCRTNPEVYQVRRGTVKRGDIVKAIIAPGGGHCMWIRPAL